MPVIFLTAATPESGRVVRGYEAGGIDFLVKPVDPHLLRSKVGVFIELFRQRLLLSAQVEQLHALQRTSELLIGVLGHDLRNPLNAISLAAETLLLARPDDEMAALIAGRIRSASQRMGRMVAQSLDFAALRSGSWPIQARDADLGQLCRTAASEFEELDKRGFDCGVQGDPRGCWDPDRILQLFSNLIGNALRHGAADVAIAVRIDGRSPDRVVIEVEHGGTLPESVRANPFAVTGETRGGADLGLYIVEQIARAHGGSVAAEARGGARIFTVPLPAPPTRAHSSIASRRGVGAARLAQLASTSGRRSPCRRAEPPRVHTIGHSTRDIDVFLDLLRAHSRGVVVDVRRWPASRRYPALRARRRRGLARDGGDRVRLAAGPRRLPRPGARLAEYRVAAGPFALRRLHADAGVRGGRMPRSRRWPRRGGSR